MEAAAKRELYLIKHAVGLPSYTVTFCTANVLSLFIINLSSLFLIIPLLSPQTIPQHNSVCKSIMSGGHSLPLYLLRGEAL